MASRKAATRKFSSIMNEALLQALQRQAESNGQSLRFVLESAVKHYLEVVIPSGRAVHPDIVQRTRKAIQKHNKLLHLLARPSR